MSALRGEARRVYIRKSRAAGVTLKKLSEEFGVTPDRIRQIDEAHKLKLIKDRKKAVQETQHFIAIIELWYTRDELYRFNKFAEMQSC